MRRTAEQERIGKWMRWAAHEQKSTAPLLSRALGLKSAEAVYRWWAGDRAPSARTLTRYAELVQKPVSYFFQDKDPPRLDTRRTDKAVTLISRIVGGAKFEEAWEAETGHPMVIPADQIAEVRALEEDRRQSALELGAPDLSDLTQREALQLFGELVEILLIARRGRRKSRPKADRE